MFLLSIGLDSGRTAGASAHTYALLLVYLIFALGVAALNWRNWWLDARLAAPAHFIDMAVFTGIVFSTNGSTSPFFLFFILPLLSAAIRWSWRETAITATALILLYITAGLVVSGSEVFELQRFIVRSGHLLILSAVLIWFGMHEQVTRLFFPVDELEQRVRRDEDPLAQALGAAMQAAQAGSGALLLRVRNEPEFAGICSVDDRLTPARSDRPLVNEHCGVMLFGLDRNRALSKRRDGWYRFRRARQLLAADTLSTLGAGQGLIAEVRTGTDEGWLVLWDIPDLSTDFLDLGLELGRVAGAVLDRYALLYAIEEGAAASTRLSLARDVHDNVLQFLAGTAFRVEAIMRGSRSGAQSEAELKELKRLLIEEQSEIRTLVSALRRDRELDLGEAVEELKTLARRLGSQWSIDCQVRSRPADAAIRPRLQLDVQQLVREAVANAVRHGGANRVEVAIQIDSGDLQLQVTDNGSGFKAMNGEAPAKPWSLKERVERAHGKIDLTSAPGRTSLTMTLPLAGSGA
jgi:signal transduction histidine kinase